MGANLRLRNLYDFYRKGFELRAECYACGRVAILDAYKLGQLYRKRGWNTDIEVIEAHLRCGACGARPGRVSHTGHKPNSKAWEQKIA